MDEPLITRGGKLILISQSRELEIAYSISISEYLHIFINNSVIFNYFSVGLGKTNEGIVYLIYRKVMRKYRFFQL